MSLGPRVWGISADDDEGSVTLHVTEQPGNLLGVSLQLDDGRIVGMALERADVQQLRQAMTNWLVQAAPRVGSA